MKEFRMQLRVYNNRLKTLREDLQLSQKDLAAKMGISQTTYNALEAMRTAAWSKARNCWSDPALKVSEYHGVSPDYLFPEDVKHFKTKFVEKQLSMAETKNAIDALRTVQGAQALPSPDVRADSIELANAVRKALGQLTPREEAVIRGLFGIGADSKTLDGLASALEVSRARIEQIRNKALLKLRHPYRAKHLEVFVGGDYVQVSRADRMSFVKRRLPSTHADLESAEERMDREEEKRIQREAREEARREREEKHNKELFESARECIENLCAAGHHPALTADIKYTNNVDNKTEFVVSGMWSCAFCGQEFRGKDIDPGEYTNPSTRRMPPCVFSWSRKIHRFAFADHIKEIFWNRVAEEYFKYEGEQMRLVSEARKLCEDKGHGLSEKSVDYLGHSVLWCNTCGRPVFATQRPFKNHKNIFGIALEAPCSKRLP